MRNPRFLILCISILLYTSPARAETLQESIKALTLLSVQHGTNEVHAGDKSFLIIRGGLSGDASFDEKYAVLAAQNGAWVWGQHNGQTSIPVHLHTYEDSLSNVRFMKSGDTLYLLHAQRPLKKGYAPSHVTFTLSALEYDADSGAPALQETLSYTTSKPHCNVDWALHVELGLPLRETHHEMPCAEAGSQPP